MAIEAGDVVWTITGDTRSLNGALRDARASADRLGASFAKHSRAIGAGMTIAGAAITATFGVAVKAAATFQKELAAVNTLGVKDLGAIEKTVKDLSVAFAVDLGDGAKAAYQAISAGASEVELPNVLADSAKAATAGFADLTTAIDLGMGTLNAFGGELKDVNEVFDLVFVAVNKGVTDFEQLAGSVGDISPLFKAAGVAADEMFAAIAAITLGGVQTSKAVTGLKGAITGILKPTADMSVLFEDMGGPLAAIQELGFLGFLEKIQEETGGGADELAKLFGSVEGLSAVLSLTGAGAGAFAETLAEMRSGVSATDEAFKRFLDANPAFAFDQMKAALSLLSVEIGKELLPSLITLARGIKDTVVGVLAWKDANPLIFKGLTLFAAGVGALLLVLGPLVLLLPSIAAGVSLFGVASGGAAVGVGALAITSGLAFLGVGALVVAASAGLLAIAAFALETVKLGQALWQVKTSGDAVDAQLLLLIASYERAGIAIDRTKIAGLEYQAALDEINKQVEAQRAKQRDANAEQALAAAALKKSTKAIDGTTDATDKNTEVTGLNEEQTREAAIADDLLRSINVQLDGVLGGTARALATGTEETIKNRKAVFDAADAALAGGGGYFNLGNNAFFAADGVAALNRELAKTPKGGNFASGGVIPRFAAGGIVPGFANGGRIVQVGERGPEFAVLPVGTNILSNSDSKQAVSDAVRGGDRPVSMTATFGDIIVQGSDNPGQTAKEIVDEIKVEMGRQFREAQATF